jgi:hypothetical protein
VLWPVLSALLRDGNLGKFICLDFFFVLLTNKLTLAKDVFLPFLRFCLACVEPHKQPVVALGRVQAHWRELCWFVYRDCQHRHSSVWSLLVREPALLEMALRRGRSGRYSSGIHRIQTPLDRWGCGLFSFQWRVLHGCLNNRLTLAQDIMERAFVGASVRGTTITKLRHERRCD